MAFISDQAMEMPLKKMSNQQTITVHSNKNLNAYIKPGLVKNMDILASYANMACAKFKIQISKPFFMRSGAQFWTLHIFCTYKSKTL